jgi:DNA recombination protein RmuC
MEPLSLVIVILVAAVAAATAFFVARARSAAEVAAAATRLAEAQRAIEAFTAERDAARRERDAAVEKSHAAARDSAVAAQRLADMEKRIADFERLKEESLQAARAAMLTTAQQLSSKLIDDHKRENEEAKKTAEERVRQTTEQLARQFEQIANAVAQLQGQVGEKSQLLDTLRRALTNPTGAGQFAEIGLANTLKSFGLEEGRDFALQHTTEDAETGRRLRPDAVVFLPGNSVLVVDCKASKFLVEIAEAEGTEREEEAYRNLARTMNGHLRALAEKDYRSAIAATCRQSGREGEIARVLSLMYLPNDAALEKLKRADAEFAQKASRLQIMPAGPAGLASVLGFASVEINLMRQVENQEKIAAGAEALLESIAIVLGHADKVGRNIKTAADAFEKMSKSVNGRLLPRARTLVKLGLRPGKEMPPPLPGYQVHVADQEIEGEAEELPALPAVPRLVRDAGE